LSCRIKFKKIDKNLPLDKDLIKTLRTVMLKASKEHDFVFTRDGKCIGDLRKAFLSACKTAKIAGFVFHDFRHTWITNKRREGHDYFKIMAASGHRTMEVFKRYNTVDESDLRSLVDNGHQTLRMKLTQGTESGTTTNNSLKISRAGD
jgi:integrase